MHFQADCIIRNKCVTFTIRDVHVIHTYRYSSFLYPPISEKESDWVLSPRFVKYIKKHLLARYQTKLSTASAQLHRASCMKKSSSRFLDVFPFPPEIAAAAPRCRRNVSRRVTLLTCEINKIVSAARKLQVGRSDRD